MSFYLQIISRLWECEIQTALAPDDELTEEDNFVEENIIIKMMSKLLMMKNHLCEYPLKREVDDAQPSPPLTSAFIVTDAAVTSDNAVPSETKSIKIGQVFRLIGHMLVSKKNPDRKRNERFSYLQVKYCTTSSTVSTCQKY